MSGELFTYVVVQDTGFAPNPFFGVCTLATCKPAIRKGARRGDWVVGIGSVQNQIDGTLVYAMRVDERLPFDDYWTDPMFQCKRPDLEGDSKQRCGDNLYHQTLDGEWIAATSLHSCGPCGDDDSHLERDTSAPYVLVSWSFAYYGKDAVRIPSRFRNHEGNDYFGSVRNYRRNFPDDLRSEFIIWLDSQAHIGRKGEPLHQAWLTNVETGANPAK